jgi:SAM-dependent methyltransferase
MPAVAQNMPEQSDLASDRGTDLEVYRCSGCGLVQLSNAPVPYFRDVIRAAAFSGEMRAFRLEQFKGFIERYSLMGKKIIEIGCGKGEYLSLMQESGGDAYGLENDPGSVASCRKAGLNVAQGYVDHATQQLESGPFDAFFMLNFLEHFPDPNAALRGIGNNLNGGAVGLVEVPNFDMILKRDLFSEFIVDHLLYFTKETLETALRLNGFEVVESRVLWHEYILSAEVRKRPPTDLTRFAANRDRLQSEIEHFIRRFGDRNTAVWGAGHQALTLIALLGLSGRIRYIVDSAPFKQGKFSPATHIPIVAPQMLEEEPVEAVIVMAASYSDEVAGIIRQKYPAKIHVAIVRDSGLEILPDDRP